MEQAMTLGGYKRPSVNWYPGHIAKAEKMLSETLKSVDVVIEVRDARAPKATAHPRVAEWAAGRPRVVVLTKVDMVPKLSSAKWRQSYEHFGAGNWDYEVDLQTRNQALQAVSERGKYDTTANSISSNSNSKKGRKKMKQIVSRVENVLFIDAKRGQGVHAIHRAVLKAGSHVNERRKKRGLSERPLRVGVIGYPNVGKSALINRILGRKRARSANTPGITRSLQWIRVRNDKKQQGKDFELLDSPGIIPANLQDQSDALLLAACNSIGTGAYDNQGVAAYLFEWLKTLHIMGKGEITSPQWRNKCLDRYGFDPMVPPKILHNSPNEDEQLMTGEDMVFFVADATCRGDVENASRKMLQDFRSERLGPISLQLAPESEKDEGQTGVKVQRGIAAFEGVTDEIFLSRQQRMEKEEEEMERKGKEAMEAVKERGLELPPMMGGGNVEGVEEENEEKEQKTTDKQDSSSVATKDIGKGMFDGW